MPKKQRGDYIRIIISPRSAIKKIDEKLLILDPVLAELFGDSLVQIDLIDSSEYDENN